MTVMINCKDVFLEYPGAKLLSGVTLGVDEGDRIGIVGLNGSGKSSLLSVLCGRTPPDSGEVTLRGGITVGLLAQSDALCDDDSVLAAIFAGRAEHEWAAERRIREIIEALIGDVSMQARIAELSGGQRRRVDLARLLCQDFDVLMLDEPTNHLDMPTIAWLAEHLGSRWPEGRGTLLLITHDRWFLDEVAKRMWEVALGKVRAFEGGYSAYIQQRAEREANEQRAEQRRQNIARKELAWLARGAQARSTKPKLRVKAARELVADLPPVRNALELKRVAMQRLGKQVVDLIMVSKSFGSQAGELGATGAPAATTSGEPASPVATTAGELASPAATTSGELTPPTFREVIKPTSWIIGPGERIGILGLNGEGKSTLLGLICGDIAPSSGRVKIGASVRFGHLSQRLTELIPHENETVFELLKQCKGYCRVDGKDLSPAKLLERLGFARDQLQTRVSALSGGQRRRVQLLITLLAEPNVLILDEPGNDLDTDMLAVMEDLLDNWPGTLLLVSHDRYLTERVTDDQYALIDGELKHMPGGVDQFLQTLAKGSVEGFAPNAGKALAAGGGKPSVPRAERTPDLRAGGGAAPNTPNTSVSGAQKTQLTASEKHQARKQAASLERKMRTLEQKIAALNEQMLTCDPTDFDELIRLGKEDKALKEQLSALEDEWLELV